MTQTHQKHSMLIKKHHDKFAPNEIAILGSTCSVITDLVTNVSHRLSTYKLAYLDASHAQNVEKNILSKYTFHHEGGLNINTLSPINPYRQQIQFSEFDYVFINGNHYQGRKQVLILDDEKETSVLKRIDQLQQVQFIITLKPETKLFSFLLDHYPYLNHITTYHIDDIDKITRHFKNLIEETIAPVRGLVLIGGKSIRMGVDKSTINYHGTPQKDYIKNLLNRMVVNVMFSVTQSQNTSDEIVDTFIDLGPFGGICSAFRSDPNSAWLVVATDLPFVDDKLIALLLQERDPSKVATAIKGKGRDFPEPLITIYEPRAYGKLLQYLAQGHSCPRKMLINSDIKVVEVDPYLIENVNTPEELEDAKNRLN